MLGFDALWAQVGIFGTGAWTMLGNLGTATSDYLGVVGNIFGF